MGIILFVVLSILVSDLANEHENQVNKEATQDQGKK
jgi:hypothetical protein